MPGGWVCRHPSEKRNAMRYRLLGGVLEGLTLSFPQGPADMMVHPSEPVLEALTRKDLRGYS